MTANGRIRADRLRAAESLYGRNRDQRPSDLRGHSSALPAGAPICPFCPGNEKLTAPLLTADPGPDWQSRVIENLYPAVVEPDGRHEVIVELRAHDARWTALDAACIERVLRVYREREAIGYADGYAFVATFKNSGAAAGASLMHPHAQVIAFRTIPCSIVARLERLTPQCDVCDALSEHAPGVIVQSGTAVAYIPNASRSAFEVRIAPRVHAARFSQCSQATLSDVARVLADVLKRLADALGEDFPFNMIVQSAARDARAQTLMHWELELVPRRENFGGFEIGTGGFIVSRTPEAAAQLLRDARGAVRA